MTFSPLHKFFLLLAGILLALGCREKNDLANWDVDILVPLASGSINLSDYVPEDYIAADGSGLLNLVISEKLLDIGLDTLIGIPDTTIKEAFTFPASLTLPPGAPFFGGVKETDYKIRNAQLTLAEIRESEIEVFFKNTIDKPVLFRYSITSATKDGNIFEVEERVEANSSINKIYTLNGYTLDLRGLDGGGYNTIVYEFTAMIHPSETDPHTFKVGDQVAIENTIRNVSPQYVKGYFGNEEISFTDSAEVDFLSRFPFESLNITEFDVVMTIDNGIGADLRIDINKLASANTKKAKYAELEHSIIGSTLQFARAIDLHTAENEVKHVKKGYKFTDANSNLDELLEVGPDKVITDLSMVVNPLGNISLGNDFVYYGHNLSAVLDIRVPLVIGLQGLLLDDTTAFRFGQDVERDVLDQVNEGFIRCIFDNGYPFDAGLQLYLQDSSGATLDSLLPAVQWIDGAGEEVNGRVAASQRSIIEVPVNRQKLEILELSNALRIKAILNTVGTDSVHVRDDYRIDYRIVGDFNVNAAQ